MLTNFNKVSEFNTLIGNAKGNPEKIDWVLLKRQFVLIAEELREISEAIELEDFTELRDGIADVLVTTYGLAHVAGVDADVDMEAVHTSNMSKFCHSKEEVRNTIAKYAELGVNTFPRETNKAYAVVSNYDQVGSDGKEYPKGKLLKSVYYEAPNFV